MALVDCEPRVTVRRLPVTPCWIAVWHILLPAV